MVGIAGLGLASASAATTSVSLTFDDGRQSQWAARSILASHGMHATFYVNSGVFGVDENDYRMPLSRIQDLGADGHEITGHSLTHAHLTTLSANQQRHEICDDRQNLLDLGFAPVVSFAYPFAEYNATTKSIVQECGYTTGRDVGGLACDFEGCEIAEPIPPVDAFATRTLPDVASTTTLSTMQSYVTEAENNGGGWIQFVFHSVCSGCDDDDGLSITPARLSAFLDWIQPRTANETFVRTVAEVMGAGPPTGFPHPKAATPTHVSLVPAYAACASPNRVHAEPLSHGSCSPPQQTSDYATAGTLDANGAAANQTGFARWTVTPGDVNLTVHMTDVRQAGTLGDYAGELRLQAVMRVTDRLNTPDPEGAGSATVQDSAFGPSIPCASTTSATTGADCSLSTTVNSLIPGVVVAGARSNWELGALGVYDGGADGDGDTQGDNTLYATQGVFVP